MDPHITIHYFISMIVGGGSHSPDELDDMSASKNVREVQLIGDLLQKAGFFTVASSMPCA
jgi:hypothetical protein